MLECIQNKDICNIHLCQGVVTMQVHGIINRVRLGKLLALVSVCFAVSACNTVDLSYISRDEIKQEAFAPEMASYFEKKPMNFGAIRLSSSDAKEGDPGQIFVLQRRKSVYMFETKVRDTGDTRYFFSAGIDYKNKTPAVGFRVEF